MFRQASASGGPHGNSFFAPTPRSLMGTVGLNGAAAAVDPAEQRLRVANASWARRLR
jgi:hypothetical protein